MFQLLSITVVLSIRPVDMFHNARMCSKNCKATVQFHLTDKPTGFPRRKTVLNDNNTTFTDTTTIS